RRRSTCRSRREQLVWLAGQRLTELGVLELLLAGLAGLDLAGVEVDAVVDQHAPGDRLLAAVEHAERALDRRVGVLGARLVDLVDRGRGDHVLPRAALVVGAGLARRARSVREGTVVAAESLLAAARAEAEAAALAVVLLLFDRLGLHVAVVDRELGGEHVVDLAELAELVVAQLELTGVIDEESDRRARRRGQRRMLVRLDHRVDRLARGR